MHPEIGPWHLNSYWLVTCLAFLPVLVYSWHIGVHVEHVPGRIVSLFIVLLFIAQFLGGGLIPYFYDWYRVGVYMGPYKFWATGRYFHGVLFSALFFYIGYVLAVRRKILNFSLARFLDYFIVGVCMMSAVGRVGCFLQGCCAGKPTHSFLGVKFPELPEPVHPTQLYHLVFEGFILLPLLFSLQKKKRFEGETFWAYLCIYSAFRFFIEFIRTNPVVWLGLTHAQIFSGFLVLVSGIFLRRGIALKESKG